MCGFNPSLSDRMLITPMIGRIPLPLDSQAI